MEMWALAVIVLAALIVAYFALTRLAIMVSSNKTSETEALADKARNGSYGSTPPPIPHPKSIDASEATESSVGDQFLL